MKVIDVTARHASGRTEERSIKVTRIANCGLAGRTPPDDRLLAEYEEKWEAMGVDTSGEPPYIFPKPNHLITTEGEIEVSTTRSAGEVEFVLFPTEETVYVGVGFDHKDRDVANEWHHAGNSTCPSIVSDEVWAVDEIEDHWDELRIRSWTGSDGEWEPFQHGLLGDVLPPGELLERIDERITPPLRGTSIWSGTFGTESGEVDPFPKMTFGDFYAAELFDPVLDRRLFVHYDVDVIEWAKGVTVD